MIAFLGKIASYSFVASQKYFGDQFQPSPKSSIEEVFRAVKNGTSTHGVVPLENSTSGSVPETYDHLFQFKLRLVGEVYLKIHHHLLIKTAKKSPSIMAINTCYSHLQAFAQCSKFLKKHPWIKRETATDTGSAAHRVSQSCDLDVSAIGNQVAAKTYHLHVLCKNIENEKENFTRFGIIGRTLSRNGNKISLLLSLHHVPGSLVKVLLPFAREEINLTKIESRPVLNKTWEYIFYIDFDLGAYKTLPSSIMQEIQRSTQSHFLLGQYDKGEIYEA